MVDFFKGLDYETATEVEALTRLIYELRQNRKALLDSCAVGDETALLEQIRAGGVDEHPAYEQYLAARILADTCEAARDLVAQKLKEAKRT
jgi:hypothetical protein